MSRIFQLIKRGLIFSLLVSSTSYAAPVDSETEWNTWPAVGEAQLSVFIFDVYQSRLQTPNGTYSVDADITPHPLALSIDYQRDISQQQLLDATEDQWEEMGFDKQLSQRWIQELVTIFPNIEKGQNLTYVTDGQSGHFYFRSNEMASPARIGSITDESLNDAFLAIWLSPKTTYPKLRAQLIGLSQ
ncbi:periplasmic protein [Vibrio caribbeanicus]|uniref:Periplasmic protein n=1 Tax=Vibrio caribbeanicus TaxID=701175 RepID=A0ACC4NW37_9VIBR|nr:chalcone isomerase family protein [Vibrio caribbeanicus]KHD24811.1 periplasmic protein [Vibrio caribbeanicus]